MDNILWEYRKQMVAAFKEMEDQFRHNGIEGARATEMGHAIENFIDAKIRLLAFIKERI